MPAYELTYFNGRGRAEVSRYMFKMKEVEFKDTRIEGTWKEFKSSTPFGQIPIMTVDGQVLCQSLAIERLLAKRFGMYGEDDMTQARSDMVAGCAEDLLQALFKNSQGATEDEKDKKKKEFADGPLGVMLTNFEKMMNEHGFFIGSEIMWADLSVAHILTFIDVCKIEFDLSKYTKLYALKQKVESHPKIAAWIQIRPESTF